jgi:hypothetical protein
MSGNLYELIDTGQVEACFNMRLAQNIFAIEITPAIT